MISSPNSNLTWYWSEDGHQEVWPILRTPHYSSLVDRFQDDGFGNPIPVKSDTDEAALCFILEELH